MSSNIDQTYQIFLIVCDLSDVYADQMAIKIDFPKTAQVLLLWLVGLATAAQFAKFAIPFDLLRQEYPDQEVLVGWMLTLISAIGAVLGMTAGLMIVRAGLVNTLIIALLLGALMSFLQSFMPSPYIMLVTRFIEGLSHLIIVIAAPTLIAQICTDKFRGVGMTLWSTFFGVSFAIVAWVGLPFAQKHGLSALILGHGALMLVLTLAVWLSFRSIHQTLENAETKGDAEDVLSLSFIINRHLEAYRSNPISAPSIGWLFYTLTFVSLLAILPDLLPADKRALIVGLMPLASIFVSLIIVSALIVYISSATAVILGFIGGALLCLSYFLAVPMSVFAIALFAILGLVQGASFTLVPELNKTMDTRTLSNGAMAQMGNIGNLLGTPILLLLSGAGGADTVILSVAIIYCLGAVIHMALAHARKGAFKLN